MTPDLSPTGLIASLDEVLKIAADQLKEAKAKVPADDEAVLKHKTRVDKLLEQRAGYMRLRDGMQPGEAFK